MNIKADQRFYLRKIHSLNLVSYLNYYQDPVKTIINN